MSKNLIIFYVYIKKQHLFIKFVAILYEYMDLEMIIYTLWSKVKKNALVEKVSLWLMMNIISIIMTARWKIIYKEEGFTVYTNFLPVN